MRIAVTGASGNLGSALLRRLSTETSGGSDVAVLGIARRSPADLAASGADEWLELDVSDDGSVSRLTERLRGVDVLVHLAWKLQPGRDETQLWQTNVHGLSNVLAASAGAGVPRLVVITSVGAYSPASKTQVVDESWPTAGVRTSQYSRQKAEVERLLDRFESDYPQVTVARVRPALVFQRGAASEISRLFLGPLVPVRFAGRVPIPVLPLPGAMTFQVIHADDVASGIWTIIARDGRGAFNLASEPIVGPDELAAAVRAWRRIPIPVAALRAVASATWRLRLQPTEPGWIDLATQCPIMSTERIRALGWAPEHSASQALNELVGGLADHAGNSLFAPLISRTQRRRP